MRRSRVDVDQDDAQTSLGREQKREGAKAEEREFQVGSETEEEGDR